MKASNLVEISKIFSPVFMDKIALGDISEIESTLITVNGTDSNLKNFSLRQILNKNYNLLKKNYRNEYFYKNTLFNNIILKNHNLNNCLTLCEFPVGKSMLDVAVFNGTSTAYEIKSEKDTPKRLLQQLDDYIKSFEFVYLVTHKNFAQKVLNLIPPNVGVLVLSENNNDFSLLRTAKSNIQFFEFKYFFDSLRLSEIKNIILKKFGSYPNLPNTLIYKECFKLFSLIPINELHNLYICEIRKREMSSYQKKLINKFPKSLKISAISKRYTEKQCENIRESLEKVF